MKRVFSVLIGSVIAAAFLGPGTVTTAARAGAAHGFQLLWTLLFATAACLVLQEACARLTIASGHNLGEALRRRFHHGLGAVLMLWLVLGAIVLGCAAYEHGHRITWCRFICTPVNDRGACGRLAPHSIQGKTQSAIAAYIASKTGK